MSKIENIRPILLTAEYGDEKHPEILECFPNGPKRTIGIVEVTLENGVKGYGEGYLGVFAPNVFKSIVYSIVEAIKESLTDLKSMNIKYNSGKFSYEDKIAWNRSISAFNKNPENREYKIDGKDEDGFFYITGRKSRDIKLFGHRISLDEIEQILFKKGYNCSCCGSDDEVTIFHIDNTYNTEILEYISKTINIHMDCFKLKHIKKFPLNENGKISYKKLEKFS